MPNHLRTEYLVDPLAVHELAPRLSWVVTPAMHRGHRQSAYHILVASTAEKLAGYVGDLWDSGKVVDEANSHIAYAGKPLAARQVCHWKVRVWDGADKPSDFSDPATWEMGLLTPSDWTAHWIDARRAGPVDLAITSATYCSISNPAHAADVTTLVGKQIKPDGLSLRVDNDHLGGDPAKDEKKHLVVSYQLDEHAGEVNVPEGSMVRLPASEVPQLRKRFSLPAGFVSARLHITALGIYEAHVNGQRVGDHHLAPGFTDFNKRVTYQTFDVTSLLRAGDNALGVLLSDGWYAGHVAWKSQVYGKVPAVLAQLEVRLADGSFERIVTDGTWKTVTGAIISADLQMGEYYDTSRETVGWSTPAYEDATWRPATLRTEPARQLDPQLSPPVRVLAELHSQTVAAQGPGKWIVDMGQNMVGIIRLAVHASKGTRITMRHGEMLNPDGTLYTENLRKAACTDTYIARGSANDIAPEVFQPRFTFHGFRYVEITTSAKDVTLAGITGIVVGSDCPVSGTVACSDPRINQLQSNIVWGQRGNFLSVPTDCPQRDERLGWMGDAQVFVLTSTKNADVASFFTKWLIDVDDAQRADGRFTNVSPDILDGESGSPAWGDAGVICPWTIYQAYGDLRLLEHHLPSMTRWVEWCRTNSSGLIRDNEKHDVRGSDFGDWLSIAADTPKDLIGTAYFAYSTHLLAKSYAALGHAAEAAKYSQLFTDIKAAFNLRYVKPDGSVYGNTQCGYVMSLHFDLLPDALRPLAAGHLVADIKAKGNHLSTGFVGVSYLLPVLTAAGQSDVAFDLLMQDTFPSWLFSVKHGATTIWERWDGWTPDKGFQDVGMNSFNHYSLGSCGQWLYESLAGISPDPDFPAYRRILFQPHIGGGLTNAKAVQQSLRGEVSAEWRLTGRTLTYNITVPVGSTGVVDLPATSADAVRESGKTLADGGLTASGVVNGRTRIPVTSGTYSFTSAL